MFFPTPGFIAVDTVDFEQGRADVDTGRVTVTAGGGGGGGGRQTGSGGNGGRQGVVLPVSRVLAPVLSGGGLGDPSGRNPFATRVVGQDVPGTGGGSANGGNVGVGVPSGCMDCGTGRVGIGGGGGGGGGGGARTFAPQPAATSQAVSPQLASLFGSGNPVAIIAFLIGGGLLAMLLFGERGRGRSQPPRPTPTGSRNNPRCSDCGQIRSPDLRKACIRCSRRRAG